MPASFPRVANSNLVSLKAWNAFSRKCSSIVSISTAPALETPPPITIASGFTTQAMLERVEPKISPNSSTNSFATASPALQHRKYLSL